MNTRVLLILLGLVGLGYLAFVLRSGVIRIWWAIVRRNDDPVAYWLGVIVLILASLTLLLIGFLHR